jgi:hypothetical protein
MSDPNVSHSLSKDKCVPIPSQVTPSTSEEQKPSTHGLIGHPALKLSNTIDKLKPPGPDSNYLKWSWILDMHFNTTGVGYIIDPAFPHPERSPTFSHDNGTVCSVLAQTINPANIWSIQQFNKDAQKIWVGLCSAHQDSSSRGIMYYMRKLFLSHMQGDNIEAHLDHMSKIFEQLNSLTNPERPLTQNNFFATAIFTSLSQDWLPCVSALMKEPFVALSKVTAALKQEGLRWKAQAEDILDTTTVASAKTKPQSTSANQDGMVKRCVLCNADGHNLYTCFNTSRILREAKDQRNNGGNGQSDSNQPAKKKGSKPPSKPAAKAGQTLVAHLGSSMHNDEEDTDYSGSEIGVVSHQAVCSLSIFSTINPRAIGDLNLDSGCSMTMLPDAEPLINLRKDNTTVHLANQSTIDATKKGTYLLPLSVKTNVKALVVPSLHEPLLLVENLCDKDLSVVFTKDGCKIYPSAYQNFALKPVGHGYRRGNLYYLPAEPLSSNSSTHVSPTTIDSSLLGYHICFSHIGLKPLRQLLKLNKITPLVLNEVDVQQCPTCVQRKLRRKAFKSCQAYQSKTHGKLIHSDVGSYKVNSREGYQYYVKFVDNCSKFTSFFPMKYKSDVFNCFKLFCASFEKNGNHTICALHSDNGGEYVSNDFTLYLASAGICHEPGPPPLPRTERSGRVH